LSLSRHKKKLREKRKQKLILLSQNGCYSDGRNAKTKETCMRSQTKASVREDLR